VVQDALIATAAGDVHAMHDPTEGGVATGIYEITGAAGLGAVINADAIPFYPETQAICNHLDLNPLGLIASGSLLAAVAPEDASAIITALKRQNIQVTQIGTVCEGHNVIQVSTTEGTERPLPTFTRDEIARLFESPPS
jgi:hydrogenase maturation factor